MFSPFALGYIFVNYLAHNLADYYEIPSLNFLTKKVIIHITTHTSGTLKRFYGYLTSTSDEYSDMSIMYVCTTKNYAFLGLK